MTLFKAAPTNCTWLYAMKHTETNGSAIDALYDRSGRAPHPSRPCITRRASGPQSRVVDGSMPLLVRAASLGHTSPSTRLAERLATDPRAVARSGIARSQRRRDSG